VLETGEKQLENSWLGLGAPNSVRCARPVSGEQAALGTRRRRTTIIHRTVRWCTGLSGESSAAKSSLLGEVQRRMAIIHWTVRWCTGLSGEPTVDCANGRLRNLRAMRGRANGRQGALDCPVCTGQCPVRQLQRSDAPEKEGDRAPDSYSDCLVRHPTKGKISLPRLPPMAPSCLGAIKGTPRRMEESPKHTLSILSLPHSVSAHLIDCVSDLSSVLVVKLIVLHFELKSWLVCVCIAADLCVLLPTLTLVLSL
jgi:hypothetical protein